MKNSRIDYKKTKSWAINDFNKATSSKRNWRKSV